MACHISPPLSDEDQYHPTPMFALRRAHHRLPLAAHQQGLGCFQELGIVVTDLEPFVAD
jgi:hypothetical protein